MILIWNAAILAATLALASTNAHSDDSWIENAYLVDSQGSSAQLTEYRLDGPAPWLYIDLAGVIDTTADFPTWVTASWQHAVHGTLAGSDFAIQEADKLWLQPVGWDSLKALGEWRVTPSIHWFDCIIIYGVGTCSLGSTQASEIAFLVTDSQPVPEPSTYLMLLAGILGVAVAVRKKRAGQAELGARFG